MLRSLGPRNRTEGSRIVRDWHASEPSHFMTGPCALWIGLACFRIFPWPWQSVPIVIIGTPGSFVLLHHRSNSTEIKAPKWTRPPKEWVTTCPVLYLLIDPNGVIGILPKRICTASHNPANCANDSCFTAAVQTLDSPTMCWHWKAGVASLEKENEELIHFLPGATHIILEDAGALIIMPR